jgi:hypothetical protein
MSTGGKLLHLAQFEKKFLQVIARALAEVRQLHASHIIVNMASGHSMVVSLAMSIINY